MLKMFDYKYLSPSQLKGLENYKYMSIDTSPLSNYVMNPIWSAVIKVVPKWIAPNTITMFGFIFVLIKVGLLMVYDYEYYAAGRRPNKENLREDEMPNFIYIICGIMLFLYYILDALDGKQARRVGVAGPLGELFDHGLDSNAAFFIAFSVLSIFGRDEFSASTFRMYLCLLCVVLNSFIVHCNQYITGVLYLAWGYDVSMWVCSTLFLIAGIKGPTFFKLSFGSLTFFNIIEISVLCIGLTTTLFGIAHNYSQKQFTIKYNLFEGLRSLFSMTIMITIMTSWALVSPNDIIDKYPRVFLLLFGVLFSQITTRLIISCMCNSRCETMCWMTYPLLVGVFLSLWRPTIESTILHSLVIFCMIAHVHYGVCVVRQLCKHLKISCFKIPKKMMNK